MTYGVIQDFESSKINLEKVAELSAIQNGFHKSEKCI